MRTKELFLCCGDSFGLSFRNFRFFFILIGVARKVKPFTKIVQFFLRNFFDMVEFFFDLANGFRIDLLYLL